MEYYCDVCIFVWLSHWLTSVQQQGMEYYCDVCILCSYLTGRPPSSIRVWSIIVMCVFCVVVSLVDLRPAAGYGVLL